MVEITFKGFFLLSQQGNDHCILFYVLVLCQGLVLSKILSFVSMKEKHGGQILFFYMVCYFF